MSPAMPQGAPNPLVEILMALAQGGGGQQMPGPPQMPMAPGMGMPGGMSMPMPGGPPGMMPQIPQMDPMMLLQMMMQMQGGGGMPMGAPPMGEMPQEQLPPNALYR